MIHHHCPKIGVLQLPELIDDRQFCVEASNEGHEVIEAKSADEALVVLSSWVDVDLVVTDVHMPGSLDGLDLTRRIRAETRLLPIIVVSGAAQAMDAQAAHATAFFRKPFDFVKLSAQVAALINFRSDEKAANCA